MCYKLLYIRIICVIIYLNIMSKLNENEISIKFEGISTNNISTKNKISNINNNIIKNPTSKNKILPLNKYQFNSMPNLIIYEIFSFIEQGKQIFRYRILCKKVNDLILNCSFVVSNFIIIDFIFGF